MSKDTASTNKLFEKLKVYKNYSNDSIFFKYIFDESDISDESSKKTLVQDDSFKPEYTHQIFGDEEVIFGYKNLHIDYYLTPGLLDAYIGVKCREKISPQRFDGIEPDDVYAAFKEFGCSPGFTKNIDTFCSDKLKQDREFTPYGNKIYEYTKEVNGQAASTFEIYKMDSSCADFENQKFIDYILRVQTMLVYFIETSCFVDTEDPQWVYYLLYEKRKNTSSQSGKLNSGYRYVTIGYLSVYNYYAYPDKIRARISQIMVFPKYQNAGHGAEMVECVFRDACHNQQIIDVTAESPSPEFMRLRDFITTKMCSSLPVFKNKETLAKGFSTEMAQEALKTFKIPKFQSRRCYEILRMAATNKHSAQEWTNFRLDVKKRFYKPFLNKSKFARNAGGSIPNGEAEESADSAATGCSSMAKGLESRMGGSASRFESAADDESESGVTQIGFGSKASSSSKPAKAVSFSSRLDANEAKPASKSVSFSAKVTSLNTSNSTTDKSDDEDSVNENKSPQENLFISEKARKEYLEQQFQESVEEYTKIIKRLENVNVLI